MVLQVSPRELKQRLDAGERPTVLDVREAWELELARLPEVVHIPMGELARRANELDTEQEVIVLCRSGGRSLHAAHFLATRGFKRVANLDGGILAWSREVDPDIAQY
jgi:sulfur-carrier protein adenylyltransferase/sulfurtransferase